DQASSPLGRQRHLRLVRKGVLPGARDGRRVLVRRSDLDAYLESKLRIKPIEDDEDVDAMFEAIGGNRR
ncbi:MAG: helix-turn-helix domain-containing protein, partial [Mycobacteriales bacterium]